MAAVSSAGSLSDASTGWETCDYVTATGQVTYRLAAGPTAVPFYFQVIAVTPDGQIDAQASGNDGSNFGEVHTTQGTLTVTPGDTISLLVGGSCAGFCVNPGIIVGTVADL